MIPGEIQKAIGSHGLWKQRLAQALTTGKSTFDPYYVRREDECDFGRWLKSLPEADRTTEHWRQVQSCHAQFHLEAAKVLETALSGASTDLGASLGIGSAYGRASAKLTSAMMSWESSLP